MNPPRTLAWSKTEGEARDFLTAYYQEVVRGENGAGENGTATNVEAEREARWREIRREIERWGTYVQTPEELLYGARVAWRNSTRCIGRHYWRSLKLLDHRSLTSAEAIFEALVEYLELATHDGKIQPCLVALAPPAPGEPGIRIWNEQLIRYAGYRQADGSVVGDPRMVEFTEIVQRLGWRSGRQGRFDVLPLVLQMPGAEPRLFELPEKAVFEVAIEHPEEPSIAELGLRWHALPAISNMRLEAGGVSYTAAPFNGWYMGTEVGARNLADVDRYNQLPAVARCFDLDTSNERTLWRDRALIELNRAVLHSFEKSGVRMVDHHTASEHFVCFEAREESLGRPTYADWAWVVPPISSSASPLFHRPYEDVELTPNFFYQEDPWRLPEARWPEHTAGEAESKKARCPFAGAATVLQGRFHG